MKNFYSYLMLAMIFISSQSLFGGQSYSTPKESLTSAEIHYKYSNYQITYKTIDNTPIIIAGGFVNYPTLYFIADQNKLGNFIFIGHTEEAVKSYIAFMNKHFMPSKEEFNENKVDEEADTKN